ncbi:hypothetical protein ACH5RR_012656 [Cinchona calisaya]|uniref:Receptor-like serine/threonine-protein kinase n=1 Tax=Cinchona calisaya TaxID=153742 RepID=A0ABD3ABZ6_9GENT
MAAILLFLLLSAYYSAGTAQQSPLNISLGSSLTPTSNSSWLSPSRLYAFGFYQQGNGYAIGIFLAGIPQRTVVWTANRDNPIVPMNATLVLSIDGRLVLQQTQGQDIDIANPPDSISTASMLDSGNFVLYNSARNVIWQSFDHPTNALLPGQTLKAGQKLFSSASETDSSRGIFGLEMQADGNLVQYPVGTPDAAFPYYWTSRTEGQGPNATLNLEDDGHLYLLVTNGTVVNLTVGGHPKNRTIYLARIDVHGIFGLYSHSLDRGNWSTIWEPTNKCDPKGLCGVNSFCILMDKVADCRCLPGFDFVNQGNWTTGCERNFTVESCKSKAGNVTYDMRSWDNMQWENNPYEVLEATRQEDCKKACFEDCNCEAALFRDRECRKQKLPLRFGKSTTDSTITFVKVGILVSYTQGVPSNLPKINKEVRVDVLVIGITLTTFGVLMFVLTGVYAHRNRLRAYKNISEDVNVEYIENVAPRAFTFAELEQATNDFREELGRGAFGAVYKGILPNSQKVVAVKKLEKMLEEGETEFQNEILAIGKTHHRNLVRLLGYCIHGPNRLLVYEYMSNGSLADIIFTPEKKLNWDYRIEIASQIARGILYLHEECEIPIIHCDIKLQNLLMDEKRCTKISDFGLAKLLKHDQTKTYTGIRGTKGYVAPEWHRKLPVTVKVDVYSFGIVLLEIICCRKNIDWSLTEDQAVLEEWVYDCFEAKELHKLVNDEEVDMSKLERVIKIAIWCIQDEPAIRPSMKKVLLMLEGTVDIPVPPCPTSFLSSK